MRVLVLFALFGTAHAERRTNALRSDSTRCPYRCDEHTLQWGAGVMAGWHRTPTLELGFNVTENWLVRARERFIAHELEVGYSFMHGKAELFDDWFVRFNVYALAGASERTQHVALMFRTKPVQGADWIGLEFGVRGTHGPIDLDYAARSTTSTLTTYVWSTEGFVSMSLILPDGHRCH